MTVIIARTIKLEHATNQMVNVIAAVKMATKKISVKSAKRVIGCHPAVSSIQLLSSRRQELVSVINMLHLVAP